MGFPPGRASPSRFEYLKDYPVLYVDDEEPNLVVFRGSFNDEFEVVCASSATEALRIMGEKRIAVLLADHRMRDMTGVELCETVRERHPSVLRILVTAYSDMKTAIDAINRGGVVRYLAKPWRLDDVRQVLRDAVARVHLESTVRSLNVEILDRERLATLAAMRARLLHDLANLNIAVEGACVRLEALVDPLHAALESEVFAQVQDAVTNLRMAVDHISQLHHKRTQAARLAPASKGYYPVHDVVETVRELMRGEIAASSLRVLTDCPPDIVMWADRTDVSRILMNLISNSIHAIESAGIRNGEIRIRVSREGPLVSLEVADNGPGVSPRLARRIFEPAFTTRSERGGSGLGLAICRELAQANDGTVDLLGTTRSKEGTGGGAQFLVRLPTGPRHD